MSGKLWYNNGINEIQVGSDEVIPDGYVRGRKPLTPEQKRLRINKYINTINQKSQEEYYEKLKNIYGEENVIRYYTDERYPFICDFYIPSEDLFIEYNGTWTHGRHPFNETNLDDICKLEEWEEKAKESKYYKNAVYTWTDLDVRKQKIARENNLNYQVIY